MKDRKILNSREIKNIRNLIRYQWDADIDEYVFMQKGEDIYITTRDIERIPTDILRVNSIGIYIGELRHNQLRLGIEGSQLIGPKAKKNIFDMDDTQKYSWIKGNDIDMDSDIKGFIIMRYNKDFLGCGKIKDGRILNFYPKSRRVNANI